LARIEPDTSVTIITVACRCGAATVRCGRASAITSAPSATRSSSGGKVPAPARPRGGEPRAAAPGLPSATASARLCAVCMTA
jgi:hypothetical protein